MLPKRQEGDKIVLVCRDCGHERELGSTSYKVEERVQHTPHEKIVVVENADDEREELTEDEKRERRKAILEHFQSEE